MKEFIEFFTGLRRNYGTCETENGYIDQETGKKKYKQGWSGVRIIDTDYTEHIDGTKSIGIQPCDDNGMARFGAIDIDKYNEKMNRKYFLDIIQEKELPIIPVLSKSGGLHLYVFTTEPVKAIEIKEFLEQILFLFKLPITTEVFPKQTRLGTDVNKQKINGNFINLPYNGEERRALRPDGSSMTLDEFIKTISLNLQTREQLKERINQIIQNELAGGGNEFADGPPCLAILTKEKMKDGRDRFLYNYMVFAKKKYPDDWRNKILQAARNYFEFDANWTDDHVKKKVQAWDKKTAGHTCNQDPINSVCMKGTCLKRKFGIASDRQLKWPLLSGLTKINYKPNPEWFFTVEKTDESVQVHAKDVYKIESQKALRALLMEQAHIVPPSIKGNEFDAVLKGLFEMKDIDIIEPASGTNPLDILHKHLQDYINGVQATSHNSFKNGGVLKDDNYAYFVYDVFYDDLKSKEWRYDTARTSIMISRDLFKTDKKEEQAVFDCQKRFPGKDTNGEYYPGLRGIVRIPLNKFEKEKEVEELIKFTKDEDVV
tara:strand:- start:7346 stop:8974 length:1629 start_codon:yes stop_codon:yes gene_type:complete